MSILDKLLAILAGVSLALLGVYTAQVAWLYFPIPGFIQFIILIVWIMGCSSMVQQYIQNKEDDSDADL